MRSHQFRINSPKWLALLFALSLSLAAQSQHIKTCHGKTHWVFKQEHGVLAVDLIGKVEGEDNNKIIKVDKFELQCVIVKKETYEKETDNTDLKILTRYALQEISYQSEQLKSKLTLNAHKEDLNGKTILIWYFEMPAGQNKEVKHQVYANTVVGDKIFGLGTPRFADQTLKEVKKFLTETVSTVKEFKKEKEVCKD